MKIQFYNSLSKQTEEFKPIEPGKVKMYSCGPTVYDFAHIGNFRSFLFGDLLRRFLEFAGYDVHHVMNITDVGHMTDDAGDTGEDKMEKARKKLKADKKANKLPDGVNIENPDDPYQIADFYTNAFLEDARRLGYKIAFEDPATCMPKATDHVEGMIEMIKQLFERRHAYVASDGAVYFNVESFPAYGALSGNTLEDLRSGESGRIVDEHQALKKHPADFMLWKPDDHHIMKWDSPWGVGYPGWHIECSVMASKLLGSDVIDIHTGGEDLKFPHHECEIAQSCGASGKNSFANYWIHARFLFVEGKKMSKSSGTFYTVRDVMEGNFKKGADTDELWGRSVDPAVIRMELIKTHYLKNLNFTAKGIEDAANIVRRLREFYAELETSANGEVGEVDHTHPVLEKFGNALADDMNISEAMAVVMPWVASKPSDAPEALAVLKQLDTVLGVIESEETSADVGLEQAEQWCRDLDTARANKQYDEADQIRQKIRDAGFEVRTTKEGTTIQKQLV